MRRLLTIVALLLNAVAYAETCPTPSALQHQQTPGWKAYDSEDGQLLSKAREAQFRQFATQFVLAEWSTTQKTPHAVHCYYSDKSGSVLPAYLAKKHFTPHTHLSFWYPVSGYMHCAASMEKCQFDHTQTSTQLARNKSSDLKARG